MKDKKQLSVSAIKNGTVIDHIPAESVFVVVQILDLHNVNTQMTLGINLESERLGKKGIIKLSEVFFEDDTINKIALIAPEAKLNIIRDYGVVEKKVVEVPGHINSIAKCFNPKCITNHEDVPTKFTVVDKKKVALKCHYCEKITDKEHLEIH